MKQLLAITLSVLFLSGCYDYSGEADKTLHTLAQMAKEYRGDTGKEVSANYLNDFKSVRGCLRMLERLDSKIVTSTAVLDPWGQPIIYNTSAAMGLPDGFFQSVGPDGIANNTDDLRSH